MAPIPRIVLVVALSLDAAAAQAAGFADFAEDENACRAAGTAAIGNATGPAAARRYDATYARCMDAHIRRRQFGAAPPDYPTGEVHRFEYPDAFFSVPYATPGYGYDGFSPDR